MAGTRRTHAPGPLKVAFAEIAFESGRPVRVTCALATTRSVICFAVHDVIGSARPPRRQVLPPIAERDIVPALHRFAQRNGRTLVAIDARTFVHLEDGWPAETDVPLLSPAEAATHYGIATDVRYDRYSGRPGEAASLQMTARGWRVEFALGVSAEAPLVPWPSADP